VLAEARVCKHCGRRFSASGAGPSVNTAFVSAALSLGFFPILLGPVAIVCAGVAMTRGEKNAPTALGVSIVCMVVGMFLGAAAWTQALG
jgi:hypothetical protein